MTTYYTLTPSGTYVPADPQPVLVPEGYMVVKREPDRAMEIAGGESLYGYPYEKAVEWCKEEKFEGRAYEAATAYRAMTQAGELTPTPPLDDS